MTGTAFSPVERIKKSPPCRVQPSFEPTFVGGSRSERSVLAQAYHIPFANMGALMLVLVQNAKAASRAQQGINFIPQAGWLAACKRLRFFRNNSYLGLNGLIAKGQSCRCIEPGFRPCKRSIRLFSSFHHQPNLLTQSSGSMPGLSANPCNPASIGRGRSCVQRSHGFTGSSFGRGDIPQSGKHSRVLRQHLLQFKRQEHAKRHQGHPDKFQTIWHFPQKYE